MTEEPKHTRQSSSELLAQQQATIEHLNQVVSQLQQQLTGLTPPDTPEASSHLLTALEKSQQIIHDQQELTPLLQQLLELFLEIFSSDRAWLVYPCDPNLPFWKVPLEHCRPGIPSVIASHQDLPIQPDIADWLTAASASLSALRFDGCAGSQKLPEHFKTLGTKAQLTLAIRPATGRNWLLGIDQCSHRRLWTTTEIRLFQQLGHRLEAALSRLLSLEELENRQQQLSSLIRNQPGTVYRYAAQHGGPTLFISDNIQSLCGYPRQDFLSGQRHFSSLCHPDDRTMIEQILNQAQTVRDPYLLEYRIIDANGTIRWILEQGQAIHEADGAIKCFDGVIFDISDRQQINQELSQLRNLLSSTIDAMPSLLIGLDLQTRVSLWNREAENWTGISGAQALGKPLKEIFPELPLSQQQVEQAIRSGNSSKQSRLRWPYRQQLRVIDVTIYPICGTRAAGAVIRIDDVFDRVKMEEVMVQQDKMLSLGGLAAGLAHEVNNPLSGIMQNLQTMRNRMNENLAKNRQVAEECGIEMTQLNKYLERRELLHLLDSAADSAKRAADIIQNMLSFSRSDRPDLQPQDLRQLFDASVDLSMSSYNQQLQGDLRKIAITREFADDLPLVLCQQSRIQQVFLNLLNNGAQAMSERLQRWETDGPGQEREQPRFICRLYRSQELIHCEIEDNGKGMDEDTSKRVFEPFFTTKPAGQGTGLGMSICYFIICDQHRGRLSVQSTPGVGSCFHIELPIGSPAQ